VRYRRREPVCRVGRNEDLLGATGHLERGAAGKRQQQQTARVGTSQNQPRDPVRQRLGFAGARPRRDQQRRHRSSFHTDAIGSGAALRRVQSLQKRVDGGRSAGSVPFLFHRNSITSPVRRRNPGRYRQAKA